MLRPLNGIFSPTEYPNLLIGLDAPDDAAVYALDDDQAIISTTDFFPPVVDDPYDFGAIAAANALSDVYAMGGTPLMAINLVAFPDGLDLQILSEILRGGAEKVREAGAVIAGGHTVTDKEPKYGLSVTGRVHPKQIIRKGGAQIGDQLILTKPLGTGVITTALKRGIASEEHLKDVVTGMSRLNRSASEIAQRFNREHTSCVHAMTDITGYSLMGHGHELAHLSNIDLQIQFGALSWYSGALDYARQDIFPGGMSRNQDYFEQWALVQGELEAWQIDLLYDPQTSGGLLMAVADEYADDMLQALRDAGEQANRIGEVVAGDGKIHILP